MNDKKYIATRLKGFCNCFKNLMSVLRLHPESKTTMKRCATVLQKDNIIFDGKNPHEYIERNNWRLEVLPSDTDIPIGFFTPVPRDHPEWTDHVNSDCRHVDHQFLRIPMSFRKKINDMIDQDFKVKTFIIDIVNEFVKDNGAFDSVHLRTFSPNRTYAMKSRYDYYINKQRELFIEEINNCKNNKIFISYDYLPELEYIKEQCKSKQIITFQSKNFDNIEQYNEGYINTTDLINDFINLLILSRGEKMILHKLSTFSEVAWYYSKCNENISII